MAALRLVFERSLDKAAAPALGAVPMKHTYEYMQRTDFEDEVSQVIRDFFERGVSAATMREILWDVFEQVLGEGLRRED
jgi:hypothetical protein